MLLFLPVLHIPMWLSHGRSASSSIARWHLREPNLFSFFFFPSSYKVIKHMSLNCQLPHSSWVYIKVYIKYFYGDNFEQCLNHNVLICPYTSVHDNTELQEHKVLIFATLCTLRPCHGEFWQCLNEIQYKFLRLNVNFAPMCQWFDRTAEETISVRF